MYTHIFHTSWWSTFYNAIIKFYACPYLLNPENTHLRLPLHEMVLFSILNRRIALQSLTSHKNLSDFFLDFFTRFLSIASMDCLPDKFLHLGDKIIHFLISQTQVLTASRQTWTMEALWGLEGIQSYMWFMHHCVNIELKWQRKRSSESPITTTNCTIKSRFISGTAQTYPSAYDTCRKTIW